MGIYRPIIERAQGGPKDPDFEPSTRIFTIPTVALTGSRIPLALKAAERIMRGEKGATKWVLGSWATDMEGIPARLLDKHKPEWDLGSSEFGAKADIAADVGAATIISAAVLFGPNITKGAKLATATILGKEGIKAVWYMNKNKDFKAALRVGELPDSEIIIPVDNDGKEAVVEEAVALTLSVATNDFENRFIRTGLSGLAVAHAIPSFQRGESIRHHYDGIADEWIAMAAQGIDPYAEAA